MHYGPQGGHKLGHEVRSDQPSVSNVEFLTVSKNICLIYGKLLDLLQRAFFGIFIIKKS